MYTLDNVSMIRCAPGLCLWRFLNLNSCRFMCDFLIAVYAFLTRYFIFRVCACVFCLFVRSLVFHFVLQWTYGYIVCFCFVFHNKKIWKCNAQFFLIPFFSSFISFWMDWMCCVLALLAWNCGLGAHIRHYKDMNYINAHCNSRETMITVNVWSQTTYWKAILPVNDV